MRCKRFWRMSAMTSMLNWWNSTANTIMSTCSSTTRQRWHCRIWSHPSKAYPHDCCASSSETFIRGSNDGAFSGLRPTSLQAVAVRRSIFFASTSKNNNPPLGRLRRPCSQPRNESRGFPRIGEYEVPGMSSSAIGTSIRKLIRERPSDCGNYIRERVALLGDAQQYDAEIRRRFGDYPAFLRALHCPEDLDLHLSAKEIGTLLALSKPEPLLPIAFPLRAVAMGALNSGISLTETQSQIILKMVNELSERQPLLFAGCASSIPIWDILLLLGAAAQGGYKCALLVPDQRHALRRKQFLAKAFPRIEIATGAFSASATGDGGVNIINQYSGVTLHQEGQAPFDLIVFEDNGRYIPSPPLFLSTPRKTRWLIVANIPLETQQANDRYGIVPRALTIEPSPAPKFTEAHVNDPEALLNKVLSLTDEGRHIVICQGHADEGHADEALSSILEQLASVWRTFFGCPIRSRRSRRPTG